MKIIAQIFFLFWLLLAIPIFAFTQVNANQTFLTGYYGGLDVDSLYKNNVYIKRTESGLSFSETVTSYYDMGFTQHSTYCDEDGNPLLQWQGCYLLDAKTLSPIENGELNTGPGTVANDFFDPPFCSHHTTSGDPGPGVETGYFIPWGNFILDRGDQRNMLLVYYRSIGLPQFDSTFIYLAGIDMEGAPDGGPTVTFKDSMPTKDINLKYGSIGAVRHGNGKDWYIVYSEAFSSNWYSILFDKDGIHEPVKSVISENDSTLYFEGWSVFSPDGSKYVIHHQSGFFVLGFDRCTGKFNYLHSGKIPTDSIDVIWRFSEFSPNGRFLYLNNPTKIYQYDLEDPDFLGSETLVASFDPTLDSGIPGVAGVWSAPFRGYDGMLYYWSANGVKKISRMANPDQKGPDVGFTQYYYQLPIYPPWFPPTLIDYRTPALLEPCELSSSEITPIQISFHPNPTNGMIKGEFPETKNVSQLKIVSITGKIVWSGKAVLFKEGIDLRYLSSGIYHVLLDGIYSGRFIKVGE